MKNVTRQWLEKVEYDLDTAKAMLTTGRYLYVLFCCQQAVEKALKALYVDQKEEFPPRTHNLLQLADLVAIEITADRDILYRDLGTYYIQSRYIEEIKELSLKVNKTSAKKILDQTEGELKWLLSKIK
jgi:HEPN domain-containing protein